MDCLKNFFAIRNVCAGATPVVPRSGLYIEMLEGISVKSVANIESGKYATAVNLIDEKIQFAGIQLSEAVKKILYPDLVSGLVSESFEGGEFYSSINHTDVYHTSGGNDCGVRIRKMKSALTRLRIPYVHLLANSDVTGKILYVVDGSREFTASIPDMKAGEEIKMLIDYTAKTDDVYIKWDASDISPANGISYGIEGPAGCQTCNNSSMEWLSVRGWNNGETSQLWGIRPFVVAECDMDYALCLILQKIKLPFLYLVGAEILKEFIATDRANYFAINSKDWAREKIVEWQSYAEQQLLHEKHGIKNFLMQIDSKCFTCKTFRHGYVHP